MNIELHQNAIENYNGKFEDLLIELKVNPHKMPSHKKFETDVVIDQVIEASDIIGELTSSLINQLGEETAKFFVFDGKEIGFYANDYSTFSSLCENIQRINVIREFISTSFLKDKAFEWVRKRYKNQTSSKFWDYLKPLLEGSVNTSEIIIPLYMTQIESQFNVGKVIFKQLTKLMYESWFSTLTATKDDKETDSIKILIEKEKSKHQGYAVASMIITAENERAKEIAYEEIDRAVDILRIYDPANFHPLTNSYLTTYGKEIVHTSKHYIINNGTLETVSETGFEKRQRLTIIDNSLLQGMKSNGLDILSELLKANELTDFQKSFINALQIYSNSSLSKSISDRIVSILVSLESILLKGNEPIQQNVGERMAFAITTNGQERKSIVDNLKTIYELRSRYIHHAYEITTDKINDIQYFMMNAWRFHISLIKNIHNIKTKDNLIEKLDNMKFFGK